ncbi:MAG: zinc ribbon domain-containing protein [Clostridia bacterium]|nr:zinc ribbon domain-containing protein [Clostridia bacterium]
MKNNNKPKHFIVFKIVGFIGIIISIVGFILVSFADFKFNNIMIGTLMGTFGSAIGISCLFIGFRPEITKLATQSSKNIQQENKEDLKGIATNTADIVSDAITKTTTAIKKGLDDKIFCKHCGEKIDSDSKFCNKCGKMQ